MKSGLSRFLMVATLVSVLCLSGCFGINSGTPDFSGVSSIAELSTLRCYYHNVAEVSNDGTDLLFGTVNIGYKKAWYEYSGYVDLGIDMDKVRVHGPDEAGVVTVELPPVEILDAQPVVGSIKEVCVDMGAFQRITNEEMVEAYKTAQEEMKKEADSDSKLSLQASEHAKELIEEYITNVGDNVGRSYRVEFTD